MLRRKNKKKSTDVKPSDQPGTEQIDSPVLDQDLHGSGNQNIKDNGIMAMLPDKAIEEIVLDLNRTYVSRNLPSDDVAPLMLDRSLLTEMEHSKYRSLREGSKPDYEKSEYLLGCLLKRGPGFLIVFCEILNSIEPAKHIAKQLEQAYHEQATKEGFNRRRSSKRSHSDHDILKKKVSRSSHRPSCCPRCAELEQECEKLRQTNVELSKKETDQNKLQQLATQLNYQIKMSRNQLKQKEKETVELRELLTRAKTKIGELQSDVCIIEEKFTTYNMACTGYEQNVQLLEQAEQTIEHMTTQGVNTLERRTLGPPIKTNSLPPYGFQQFVMDSDASDNDLVLQQDEDTLAQNNGTRYQLSLRRDGGAFHCKQKSESDLLEEKSFTMERTSSQPTMRETRPRQSSVPPPVPRRTSSASTTDLGLSSSNTRGQQKLHNGMLHQSSYIENESTTITTTTTASQYYPSESDMHCEDRDTPASSQFQNAIQETSAGRPPVKPKPLTKEKPSLSNIEVTLDLSVDSSPTDSQPCQESAVTAELQSKLQARREKISRTDSQHFT